MPVLAFGTSTSLCASRDHSHSRSFFLRRRLGLLGVVCSDSSPVVAAHFRYRPSCQAPGLLPVASIGIASSICELFSEESNSATTFQAPCVYQQSTTSPISYLTRCRRDRETSVLCSRVMNVASVLVVCGPRPAHSAETRSIARWRAHPIFPNQLPPSLHSFVDRQQS